MSVTAHGRKQYISSEPRNAVDVLLELWLAASLATHGTGAAGVGGRGGGGVETMPGATKMSVTEEVNFRDCRRTPSRRGC